MFKDSPLHIGCEGVVCLVSQGGAVLTQLVVALACNNVIIDKDFCPSSSSHLGYVHVPVTVQTDSVIRSGKRHKLTFSSLLELATWEGVLRHKCPSLL